MNQPDIRSAIESEYSKCTEVKPKVYRAERLFGSHPIEVRYFDASDKILAPEFDIAEYQQTLLADDYYQNSGAIRWNYYLTFVVPDEASGNPSFLDRKSVVEQDYSLARKSVVTPAEFFNDLKKRISPNGDLPENVVEIWRSHLEKAGIKDALDLDIAYDDIVDSFISGTFKKTKSSRKPKIGDSPTITSIDELHVLGLSRPRPPVGTNFIFKRVNLISGPNASGKTSLLESLELALCGNTLRADINNLEEIFQFEIRTNQNKKLELLKKLPIQEYRNRDSKWYGNTYIQKNFLPKHFAKFNFFDADAAKRFSEDMKDEEINSAILGVIFGPESSQLQKRLATLGERFGKEAKRISNEMMRLSISIANKRTRITANKQKLEDLSKPQLNVSTIHMKLPPMSESETDKVLAEWAAIKITLENISDQDPATGHLPVGVLNSHAISLEGEIKQLTQLAKMSADQEHYLDKLRKQQFQADKKIENIQLLKSYLNVHALELLDLPDQLVALQRRIDPLQLALANINITTLDLFDSEQQLFSNLVENSKIELDDTQNKFHETNQQLASVRAMFSGIEALRQEILDRGTMIIQQLPDLNECPLCGIIHKSPSLSDLVALQHAKQFTDGADSVTALIDLQRSQSTRLESLRQRVDYLQRIQNCLDALCVTKDPKTSLAMAVKEIDQARKNLSQLASEKEMLSSKLRQLEASGFLRSELIDTLSVLGISSSRLVEDPDVALQEAESAATKMINELSEASSAATVILTNLQAKISASIENCDIKETDISEAIQTLSTRVSNLQTVQTFLERLNPAIVAAEETPVNNLPVALGHFHVALSQVQQSLWLSKELAQEEAEVKKEDQELLILDGQKKRAISGERVIANLIQQHGLEKYGEQFLNQNSAAIKDFFLRIHAPREFSDLVIAKDHLKLIRIDNKQTITPAQISTGQRSALALSVFLTINQLLQNGPNLLLLDDPVTYVDDLNILAFIDFLRQIAIQGNRQIFFATANRRIADIFRVKMEFLGDDFAEIALPTHQGTPEPMQTLH